MGGEHAHRRSEAAALLADLLGYFQIDLLSYAIMSNHVHFVMRSRPDVVASLSDSEVARKGLGAFPVRVGPSSLDVMPVTRDMIVDYAGREDYIAEQRLRLSSISWLMKLFKQRFSRKANKEDGCSGHFWKSRFLTVPLLDNAAIYSCMAYVDRNPIRAGMVRKAHQSLYCSASHRLTRAKGNQGGLDWSDGDKRLGKRLVPLSRCAGGYDGAETMRAHMPQSDYALLVQGGPSKLSRITECMCLDADLWVVKRDEPGLFQGVAVGGLESRRRFAAEQGKGIVADKTGVFV